MSSKVTSTVSKYSCDRFNKYSNPSCSVKSEKTLHKPKKVVVSKKLIPNCRCNEQNRSATTVCHSTQLPVSKPKKITKSDFNLTQRNGIKCNHFDICKECGDVIKNVDKNAKTSRESIRCNSNKICNKDMSNKCYSDSRIHCCSGNIKTNSSVQQYYKNENYDKYIESVHDIDNSNKKINPLDPIRELSEIHTVTDHKSLNNSDVFNICDSTEEFPDFLDPDNNETLQELKEFRRDNYFECHSAKSRIKNKVSVTSLKNHKCVYRFYLNNRLFPVPLTSDHNGNIRCVECNLPLDFNENREAFEYQNLEKYFNGTIQAKVKINNEEVKDTILLLPIKEPLIIQERRRQKVFDKDNKIFYFGIIKMGYNGNLDFNGRLPSNSLALKYQKGYKEFHSNDCYRYENVEKGDVIVI